MWLETNRLIIRSIQRGDEIIFSGMSQDGSLSQVGFDANCSEWINDWIEEALKLTNNDNPRENYIPCTVILKETEEVIGSVGSTYYEEELNSGEMEIIGKIKSEGEEYNVLGGYAFGGNSAGLGFFYSPYGVGHAYSDFGLLGCANKEIAKHLGKYFGMLITEAKYGDLDGFEIIERKY